MRFIATPDKDTHPYGKARSAEHDPWEMTLVAASLQLIYTKERYMRHLPGVVQEWVWGRLDRMRKRRGICPNCGHVPEGAHAE